MLKSWLDFDDLDLIFKVILLYVEYIFNRWMDLFKLASTYNDEKLKSWLDFSDIDLILMSKVDLRTWNFH